jgi:predicted amidophosphoribosyltransferase
MPTNTSPPQKCIRCKADLPAEVTFCVACGCQNESDTQAKRVGSITQADKRVENARGWRDLLGPLGAWLRW